MHNGSSRAGEALDDTFEGRPIERRVREYGCIIKHTVVSGDELRGLVRGLLYAGASSVLLTLWDVYDESTTDFMRTFYGHLRAGASKAGALQVGMRELRQRYPHPFFWAPFVLVGQ